MGVTGRVKIERKPLSALKAAPYNPRTIDPESAEGLRASLEEFDLVEPIVWNRRTGHVVGGHQRLAGLAAAGVAETDVVVVDLEPKREKALNVALNNPRIQGRFTQEFREIAAELYREEAALAERLLVPTLERDFRSMLGKPTFQLQDPPAPPPPKKPKTKKGDLWTLGEHRLLCGDSTKQEHVDRLMGGIPKASLLATDPPYLVDYQGGNHPQSWANKPDVRDKHWDDYKDPSRSTAFFADYLRCALSTCVDRVPVYQWHADKRRSIVDEAWEAAGLVVHQQIVWVKARPVLTRCHFMWQHEPCVYGWRKGKQPSRRPPANESGVWAINQQGEQDGIHPTQKPVELFARPIQYHTIAGEVCLEPFSGSGTQIIAAEQLGRRCMAMEISPAFVDVAVQRWETLTGKKADRRSA